MLEAALFQVIGQLEGDGVLDMWLPVLRGAAAAGDEETARLLAGGGNANLLRQLALKALNSANEHRRDEGDDARNELAALRGGDLSPRERPRGARKRLAALR
jgi:hypothetical protein